MSNNSEIKILRNEIAKVIANNATLTNVIEQQKQDLNQQNIMITELRLEISELRLINTNLKKHIKYYENPHTPPSANNLLEQKKKSDAKKAKTDSNANSKTGTKPGRKDGHQGISHNRRSTKTIHHTQDNGCDKCGNKVLTEKSKHQKQIIDIEFIPNVETVTHISYKYICKCCGNTIDTAPKCNSKGTSVGPKLTALSITLWDAGNSLESIKNVFSFFNVNVCKGTIQHMLEAAGKKMAVEAVKIEKSIENTKFFKMDETPLTIKDKRGYVWVGVGDQDVVIKVIGSRGAIVIDQYYSKCTDKPVTTDGYAVYNMFEIRQRCWAHILRESKDAVICSQTHLLHENLKTLFAKAKLMQENHDTGSIDAMIQKTLCIAEEYKRLGSSFATTLKNAAPNLFTFVRYPGMEPTNNESERMLRKPVIHRKIRQRLVTAGGMLMFGTILTCMMTWRKQGLNLTDKLLEVLGAT